MSETITFAEGKSGGGGSKCGNDFDAVDRRVLKLAGEGDVEFAVSDFDIDRFDVRLHGSAGFGKRIKILEFTAFDVEGKHPFAGGPDRLIRFGEV